MATFPQAQDTEQAPATFNGELSGSPFALGLSADLPQPYVMDASTLGVDNLVKVDHVTPIVPLTFKGEWLWQSVGGSEFFEDFHVVPRKFDFGNVLSAQSEPMEVFCAFRAGSHEWTSFVNNAGTGVDVAGLPTLPDQMLPFESHALLLNISTVGNPFVDTTLDFVFETGTALVPIELERVILWYIRPEQEYVELLGFLTDVIEAKSGKEKRAALRKNPRQTLRHQFLIVDAERPEWENKLFDYQARQLGLPIWFDNSELTAAAAVDDLVITVDDTANRDYRVGGNAVILQEDGTFDVLAIASFTATTITSDSPLLNAYPAGTEVFPMVTAYVQPKVPGARWAKNLNRLDIAFRTSNNDNNLGDLTGWTQYNGKAVIDSGMILRGQAREVFETKQVVVDGVVGILEQTTPWDGQKRQQQLILRGQGRAAVWKLRQLAHGLRGKQISFYLPRDSTDMVVNSDLLNLGSSMIIDAIGYAQFLRERQPKTHIRLTETDGTERFREITNSVLAGDGLTETLTVTPVWDANVPFGDIAEVTFIEEVRLDTDTVRLEFGLDPFVVYLVAPIKTVFE